MNEIYLIPKSLKPFDITKCDIYMDDIFCVHPKSFEGELKDILLRHYKTNDLVYDVIHLGEVIEVIKHKIPNIHINFLKPEDIVIYFNKSKKDITKPLRVFIVSIIVLMGSTMGIMNFHADVNMKDSQVRIVQLLSGDVSTYLPYFQIPYSIGIGIGVALFFNKFLPSYSKHEPSPMDLRMKSLNKEIEGHLRCKED